MGKVIAKFRDPRSPDDGDTTFQRRSNFALYRQCIIYGPMTIARSVITPAPLNMSPNYKYRRKAHAQGDIDIVEESMMIYWMSLYDYIILGMPGLDF